MRFMRNREFSQTFHAFIGLGPGDRRTISSRTGTLTSVGRDVVGGSAYTRVNGGHVDERVKHVIRGIFWLTFRQGYRRLGEE